ncbi:MAG: anti-sigma factor [Verrucomicrobiae bacterium]|nr:anti-sigma factor [Verrucomicrobiae bacterium]
MKCSQCQDLLFEYLDGTLPSASQASVQEHLRECSSCRTVFEREKQFSGSLPGLLGEQTVLMELPPQFHQKVLSRLERDAHPVLKGDFSWFEQCAHAWAGVAAIAVLMFSIAALFVIRDSLGQRAVCFSKAAFYRLPGVAVLPRRCLSDQPGYDRVGKPSPGLWPGFDLAVPPSSVVNLEPADL